MSRIYGTNDPATLEERNFPFFQIQVWKGTKKQNGRFGKDLGLEFRIELNSDRIPPNNSSSALVKRNKVFPIREILKRYYSVTEDDEGSLYVKNLNIIPYCDNPDVTFFSALAPYKNNKPLWFCDKKTIHTKFIGERGRPVKTNDLCLAQSVYDDCPRKCKEFGSFYFEIFELAMFEIHQTCRLQLTSINDLIFLADFLEKTQKEYNALRKSPFFSTQTKTFMVYSLSRIAKSNSYKRFNYPIFLQLHPLWLKEYNAYLTGTELRNQGLVVPQKLLPFIHGSEFFDMEIQDAEILDPYAINWKPSKSDIELARQLWRQNGWTKDELLKMLKSRFGINSLKEIQTFNIDQFQLLKEILKK